MRPRSGTPAAASMTPWRPQVVVAFVLAAVAIAGWSERTGDANENAAVLVPNQAPLLVVGEDEVASSIVASSPAVSPLLVDGEEAASIGATDPAGSPVAMSIGATGLAGMLFSLCKVLSLSAFVAVYVLFVVFLVRGHVASYDRKGSAASEWLLDAEAKGCPEEVRADHSGIFDSTACPLFIPTRYRVYEELEAALQSDTKPLCSPTLRDLFAVESDSDSDRLPSMPSALLGSKRGFQSSYTVVANNHGEDRASGSAAVETGLRKSAQDTSPDLKEASGELLEPRSCQNVALGLRSQEDELRMRNDARKKANSKRTLEAAQLADVKAA